MRYISASKSDVGLRRKLNEDRVLARPEVGLWAVADGMGGHEAGEVASQAIVTALAEIAVSGGVDPTFELAEKTLHEVNLSLRQLARSDMRAKTIGSTVTALAIHGNDYCCFWAGDSRTYRVRGAEIVQLTRDHSLIQDLIDARLVAPEDAEKHPDAHVITRAVGASRELAVDSVTGKVEPGDIFILASDGLTRVVEPAEMAHTVRTMNPAQAVAKLVEMVLARGAPDNVSAVVVRCLP